MFPSRSSSTVGARWEKNSTASILLTTIVCALDPCWQSHSMTRSGTSACTVAIVSFRMGDHATCRTHAPGYVEVGPGRDGVGRGRGVGGGLVGFLCRVSKQSALCRFGCHATKHQTDTFLRARVQLDEDGSGTAATLSLLRAQETALPHLGHVNPMKMIQTRTCFKSARCKARAAIKAS